MTKQIVRIGTRGSRLALVQTHTVADAIKTAHPDVMVEVVEIKTSGDWSPAQGETRLSEAQGGKGLFAKEIEKALAAGAIDCGVHSMKDMPSFLPEGLVIEHILPREDPRDAFLANDVKTVAELPQGAVVGTSSLRRQAFLLALRPDLKIVPFRGNVPTRIEKLRGGQVDATILALSGMKRLGLESQISSIIEPEEMLPAAGQGAVGIEIREDDGAMRNILAPLHCKATGIRVAAERAALQVLDGSCHTPIGAYTSWDGENLSLKVTVVAFDGSSLYSEEAHGIAESDEEAAAMGKKLGHTLKDRVPPEILAA